MADTDEIKEITGADVPDGSEQMKVPPSEETGKKKNAAPVAAPGNGSNGNKQGNLKTLICLLAILALLILLPVVGILSVTITHLITKGHYKNEIENIMETAEDRTVEKIVEVEKEVTVTVEVEKEVTVEVEKIVEVEKKITGTMIQEGIRDIGELATAEYFYTEVESTTDHKTFLDMQIPLTESSVIYSYDGTIKAGIDFKKITVSKNDRKELIIITIPKARILSNEIDNTSLRVYDEKESVFNMTGINEYNESIIDLKNRAEERAIERGLLNEAQENAEDMIRNFVRTTYGAENYEIQVKIEE